MRRLGSLLCVGALVAACGNGSVVPTAPGSPAAPSSPVVPGSTFLDPLVIQVGEEVTATLQGLNGTSIYFTVTPPAAGTLVVTVKWDHQNGPMEMILDGTRFDLGAGLLPSGVSRPVSIVGTATVVGGQASRVTISDPAVWDYGGISIPFVLTTSVE